MASRKLQVSIKRIYDAPGREDGLRVLVDRLWPRGLSKEKARLDEWLKELAPSDELRKWFGHDASKWPGFKQRYFTELQAKQVLLEQLRHKARAGPVTLLYGTREQEHNNAVALKEYLTSKSSRRGANASLTSRARRAAAT